MGYDEQRLCAGLVEFTEPTLLIIGVDSAFTELADHIQEGKEYRLPSSNCVNIEVSFVPTEQTSKLDQNGNEYIVRISPSDATIFAGLIRGLVGTEPGHNYLDLPDAITILISKGEYDLRILWDDQEK